MLLVCVTLSCSASADLTCPVGSDDDDEGDEEAEALALAGHEGRFADEASVAAELKEMDEIYEVLAKVRGEGWQQQQQGHWQQQQTDGRDLRGAGQGEGGVQQQQQQRSAVEEGVKAADAS
jgi:hypothetical protein